MTNTNAKLIAALKLCLVELKEDIAACSENKNIKNAINCAEEALLFAEGPAKLTKQGKKRIHINIWGNWNAYIGTRKVKEFGSDQFGAEEWMKE